MKILVTGSEGFIGSKLCTALHVLGHEVLRFDRKIGSRWPEEKPELIFHMAAQTDVAWSLEHYIEDASDNIMFHLKVLKRYSDVKIIYPASASSLDIKSPYGLSKKVAVDYIKLLHPDHVIIMFPNIWGPGGFGAINKFYEAEEIVIRGTGEQSRTIVHVDDVVKALVMGMEWENGEYSLGGEVLTVNEIAQKVGKPIKYDTAYKGEIFASVIPNTTPNWEPTICLR